jgi:hypothetical protein
VNVQRAGLFQGQIQNLNQATSRFKLRHRCRKAAITRKPRLSSQPVAHKPWQISKEAANGDGLNLSVKEEPGPLRIYNGAE